MSRWPVSVKGVLLREGRVVVLRNEREEWELPGGKLDPGESPEDCVVREFQEELGLVVEAQAILDSWVYEPVADSRVLIVTYGCIEREPADIELGPDHPEFAWLDESELSSVTMPDGYCRSVRAWIDETGLRDASAV